MKKLIGIVISVLFLSIGLRIELIAQQPFIVPTEGLGQYGYLEVNATTYARLNSSTFNARGLAARWWTGAEYIYYADPNGSCNLLVYNTSDYSSSNHLNWSAGTIAYVAVQFKDCIFNWQGNYNERSFQLIDVDNAYGGAFDDIITDDPTGVQNLVGSFTINSGGSSLTLDRLWITNTGTAQEGTDIPNDGIRVYYEAITGAETYDGTESFQTLYGDYNGNSSTNEQWGNENLSLPVGAAGVRCYLVVSDLAATPTSGLTALFQIQNDGISFREVRDGSYNKLRVNALSISSGAVLLPVELLGFQAALLKGTVNLHWETASEHNNDRFEIERSVDGTQWPTLGVVYSHDGSSNEAQSYTFEDKHPVKGLNYYRLKQVDADGKFEYSTIIAVENANESRIQIYPNPANSEIYIDAPNEHITYLIKNVTGRMVQTGDIMFDQAINISALPVGVYFMEIMEEDRVLGVERVVKQ
ncbi:MAG: T9SS type A sorting domain-containing protein [Saprospiraceae bacterium]